MRHRRSGEFDGWIIRSSQAKTGTGPNQHAAAIAGVAKVMTAYLVRTTITGVVLGQPGNDQIAAGLAAADAMVDRIAGHSRRLAPGTAPRSHRFRLRAR